MDILMVIFGVLGAVCLFFALIAFLMLVFDGDPAGLGIAVILFPVGCFFCNCATDIYIYRAEPINEIIPKSEIRVYEKDGGYYLNYKDKLVSVTDYNGVISIKEGTFNLYKQTYKNGCFSLPNLKAKEKVQYVYYDFNGNCLGWVPDLN